MNLNDFDLKVVQTEEELAIQLRRKFVIRKNELISKIISQLTIDPKSDKDELVKSFFAVAENDPTDRTIAAFQNMYFILKDAEELKELHKEEDVN